MNTNSHFHILDISIKPDHVGNLFLGQMQCYDIINLKVVYFHSKSINVQECFDILLGNIN